MTGVAPPAPAGRPAGTGTATSMAPRGMGLLDATPTDATTGILHRRPHRSAGKHLQWSFGPNATSKLTAALCQTAKSVRPLEKCTGHEHTRTIRAPFRAPVCCPLCPGGHSGDSEVHRCGG